MKIALLLLFSFRRKIKLHRDARSILYERVREPRLHQFLLPQTFKSQPLSLISKPTKLYCIQKRRNQSPTILSRRGERRKRNEDGSFHLPSPPAPPSRTGFQRSKTERRRCNGSSRLENGTLFLAWLRLALAHVNAPVSLRFFVLDKDRGRGSFH